MEETQEIKNLFEDLDNQDPDNFIARAIALSLEQYLSQDIVHISDENRERLTRIINAANTYVNVQAFEDEQQNESVATMKTLFEPELFRKLWW